MLQFNFSVRNNCLDYDRQRKLKGSLSDRVTGESGRRCTSKLDENPWQGQQTVLSYCRTVLNETIFDVLNYCLLLCRIKIHWCDRFEECSSVSAGFVPLITAVVVTTIRSDRTTVEHYQYVFRALQLLRYFWQGNRAKTTLDIKANFLLSAIILNTASIGL